MEAQETELGQDPTDSKRQCHDSRSYPSHPKHVFVTTPLCRCPGWEHWPGHLSLVLGSRGQAEALCKRISGLADELPLLPVQHREIPPKEIQIFNSGSLETSSPLTPTTVSVYELPFCLLEFVCFSLSTVVPRSRAVIFILDQCTAKGDPDRLSMARPLSGPQQVYRLQLGLSRVS